LADNIKKILELNDIKASAPCRIDLGGTLDIKTFYYPLRHFMPCTFNIALDLRTHVKLLPFEAKKVKITSHGFENAEFYLDKAPFDHPLGLMFAIASYFLTGGGVHIVIESSSPPKSGLGGSSAAAIALVAAFSKLLNHTGEAEISKKDTAILSHAIEESVAGVPCGLQDQLAAAYGGVNAWYWKAGLTESIFEKKQIYNEKESKDLEKRILIAYCGIPHESKDVNSKWVKQFLAGKNRNLWIEIAQCTNSFIEALSRYDFQMGASIMNKETRIRRKMTPEVLDGVGVKLVDSAVKNRCGARFTGAGGGGCIWALGEENNITELKTEWENIVKKNENASILNTKIDLKGVL